MDQLALPYRIALAGLLVFAVAWFAVLRPKDDAGGGSSTPAATQAPATPQAPGAKGLGTAIDKAKGAVATSQSSAKTTEAAVGGTEAAPATSAAKAPATAAAPSKAAKATTRADSAAAADRSARIIADVDAGKVAVVLFSNPAAADDAHVRAVLRRLDRHDGKVTVYSASVNDVGNYSAITRGVEILQGPTLLVIGKNRQARTIVGFTDRGEVQQLVDDVGRFSA